MDLITIEDFENDLLFEAASENSKATIQLFKIELDTIRPLGTGVLFHFQGHHFIITAGHVIDGLSLKDIQVATPGGFLNLEGEAFHSVDSTGSPFDVAVILISNTLSSILMGHKKFIGPERVKMGPEQKKIGSNVRSLSDYYMLMGFPEKTTKSLNKNQNDWTAKLLWIISYFFYINEEVFKNQGFTAHLFVNKHAKYQNIPNRQVKNHIPRLNGMSGGGIWDIDAFDIYNNRLVTKLAGIIIESKSGKWPAIISIKIDFVIEFIRHQFNLIQLPKSKYDIRFVEKPTHL